MPSDRAAECRWPPLPAPFDAALGDAVRFVFEEVDPVGIIATGTIVRGEGHPSSDLDIYVIHQAPIRRRVQRFFRDVPAEIFINPPHAVRTYFAEEHDDGRPRTAHMLTTGFVVYSAAPVVEALRAEAQEWLGRPRMLSDSEILQARYGVATQLEDGADVVHNDARTATMLLGGAVTKMLELFCWTRSGRVPRGKDLLATVAAYDEAIGRLAGAFFGATSAPERLQAAEALADRTIGVRGFFPWDSGPDPVPPPTP